MKRFLTARGAWFRTQREMMAVLARTLRSEDARRMASDLEHEYSAREALARQYLVRTQVRGWRVVA